MVEMIREGASSTRRPLLDGLNYAFLKARMRANLKANNEHVWIRDLPRFPNKTHRHHKLQLRIALKSTSRELEDAEQSDNGEEMAFIVRKLNKFFRGKRTDGGFKGANAKRDFVPKKFNNDKDKNKGVQCYECQSYGHITFECANI
ncbi:hypothetical protein ACOSQ3_014285 [Xanthoceras sorbifolium]